MSKRLSVRPSELAGLSGVQAFYFDRGVLALSIEIEGAMNRAEAGKKTAREAAFARQVALDSYLRPGDDKGHYRDPALIFKKKKVEEPTEMVIGGDNFRG